MSPSTDGERNPYQAPTAEASVPTAGEPPWPGAYEPRYTSAAGIARFARYAFLGQIVMAVLWAGYWLHFRSVLADSRHAGHVHVELVQPALLIGGVGWLVSVSTYVLFGFWFVRVYQNLPTLGRGATRYKPYWAIVGFIVPVANLGIPYSIAKETWIRSRPRPGGGIGLVKAWWSFTLLAFFSSLVGDVMTNSERSFDTAQSGTLVQLVGQGLWIVAAVLALIFVRRLTRRQDARHALLSRSAA